MRDLLDLLGHHFYSHTVICLTWRLLILGIGILNDSVHVINAIFLAMIIASLSGPLLFVDQVWRVEVYNAYLSAAI